MGLVNLIPVMRSPGWLRSVVWFGGAALALAAGGERTGTGEGARDFAVTDRATGRPLRLFDFVGKIVVLDFFAHWCGPCLAASADIERNIRRHYAARGGNAAGIPVEVLAINVELRDAERTADFIRRAGLERTADDARHEAFAQFDAQNSLPLVVVIDGSAGADGRPAWRVVYRKHGYDGAAALRRPIDAIRRRR